MPPAVAAGFFGKLPATGDFVARGLPDAFRRSWDRWVSLHVAPFLRDAGARWPPGGLRFRLKSGGRAAAGVILPSSDRAGRRFPLSLVLTADALPDPAALDAWCDAAATLDLSAGPDELWDRLEAIDRPPDAAGPDAVLLLWVGGAKALAADPARPGEMLATLLGG